MNSNKIYKQTKWKLFAASISNFFNFLLIPYFVAYYYSEARLAEVKNIGLPTNQNTDKNMFQFVKLSVCLVRGESQIHKKLG